jgi:hypothetical protein
MARRQLKKACDRVSEELHTFCGSESFKSTTKKQVALKGIQKFPYLKETPDGQG